jgi:hypothetical protein
MKMNKLEIEMLNSYAREQFFICSVILMLLGMILITVAFIFNNSQLLVQAAAMTIVFIYKYVSYFF